MGADLEPWEVSAMAVGDDSDRARKVFVVHGRNREARTAMFIFLRAIGLAPIEWSEAVKLTGEASPYIGNVLDAAFNAAQAVVVLLTPDNIAYLRSEYASSDDDPETNPSPQARPNVLFEAGMAMGRDPKRTVLVQLGQLRPFSDVVGRHAVRIDGSAERRKELAQRLQTAGCDVNLTATTGLVRVTSPHLRRRVAVFRSGSAFLAPAAHAAYDWTRDSTSARAAGGWSLSTRDQSRFMM